MVHGWILAILMGAAPAGAQIDSTSAVLLRPSGSVKSPQDLDTSRYKVRAPESRPAPRPEDEIEERPGTVIPTPVPTKKAVKAAPSPKPPEPVVIPQEPVVESPPPPDPPPVTEQVRDLILGGGKEDFDEYHKQIHPQDPRANVIDISMAPAYFYNGSQSGYSYRRYHTNGPGLGLGVNLWITPFFGLQSNFFTSVSAAQKSGGVNTVPAEVQSLNAGIRFRKHFGYSRKAPHLSWGFDYHDSINKISSNSTTSVGRKSNGIVLALDAVVPASNIYGHTFAIEVRPRLKHGETDTGVEARSGTKNETNSVSLSVGGQWTLDRHNRLFWRGQYAVERNLFEGSASQTDPHTGITPDGVSVTNSLVIFYFGFTWGS